MINMIMRHLWGQSDDDGIQWTMTKMKKMMIQFTFLSYVYHLSIDGVMAPTMKMKKDDNNPNYLSVCKCVTLVRVIMVAFLKEMKKRWQWSKLLVCLQVWGLAQRAGSSSASPLLTSRFHLKRSWWQLYPICKRIPGAECWFQGDLEGS